MPHKATHKALTNSFIAGVGSFRLVAKCGPLANLEQSGSVRKISGEKQTRINVKAFF